MNFKRLIALLFMLTCLFGTTAFAQEKVVTGKVTDSKDGTPLAGITIQVKGSKVATQTSADGSFKIRVEGDAKLVITSVGYAKQEVSASNSPLTIGLVQTNTTMNEVVVVGYGAVKKKDLTGSVSTVTSKDFQKGSVTSPEQLIAGKVAGVSITSNGGQPGSGSVIRIRGGASLNASNDPLIVVDGVPLSSVNLQGINPDDIESMSILKDASSAAIYGSRASNGVILITTKRGKSGKPVLSFSTNLSASYFTKEFSVLSADQFTNLVKANGNATQIGLLGKANTDWQKQIFQTALSTDNNLSVSGAIKNIPYRIAGEYLSQTGILKTDKLQREVLSINLNPRLFDNHLKVDLSVHGSNTDSRSANVGAVGNAVSFDPTQPINSGKSQFGGYYEWLNNPTTPNSLSNRNPVAMLNQYNQENQALRTFGNLQLDYKLHFLPDLHANLNVGYDMARYTGTTVVDSNAASSYNSVANLRGQNNQYKNYYLNNVFEFFFNYVKDLKAIKSNINFVAGTGYYDNYTKYTNFASYSFTHVLEPNTTPIYPSSFTESTLESYYGRLIYTYDNKYVLMGSVRTDGSSKFGPDYRWGVFPSGAFTWKANQETFVKDIKAISDLKVRLGYGITGNQDGSGVGFYNYLPSFSQGGSSSQIAFGNNFYHTWTANAYAADFKWETTATADFGIDFGLFNNRITGSVDYYQKKTKDLIATVFIPTLTNFGNQETRNVGNMEDEGVEVVLNTTPIKNEKFVWDLGFNIAYNKFTITNLSVVPNATSSSATDILTGGIQGGTGGTVQIHSVGYTPNTFYVYKQVYGTNGKPLEGIYLDQNRDGIINTSDLVRYKSPNAPFTFGFTTSLSYKKWTVNTVLRASIGNYMYNNIASNNAVINNVLNPSGFLANAPSSVLNTNFKTPQSLSSYFIENASYLKMDNLGLSYDFGNLKKNSCNLRMTLNCQNVFTVTKYTGSDPEIYGGIDNMLYPRPRTITLGASLRL